MQMLLSAWPALTWALPALVLLSAVVFLAKGSRSAFGYLLALLACFVIAALLMEFFTFMAARMARAGSAQADPVLGSGTRQLLATIANPRSLMAPPLSLPWLAAASVAVSYLWLLVAWVVHLRGGKRGGTQKAAKAPRKKAARG
ncbi:MAG: hypothetical protein HEQ37_15060 [Acidovorax sp.]|nr:hypothetical protein [Acidovorax sp.]